MSHEWKQNGIIFHATYTVNDWRTEISDAKTFLGYDDWVDYKLIETEEKALASNDPNAKIRLYENVLMDIACWRETLAQTDEPGSAQLAREALIKTGLGPIFG